MVLLLRREEEVLRPVIKEPSKGSSESTVAVNPLICVVVACRRVEVAEPRTGQKDKVTSAIKNILKCLPSLRNKRKERFFYSYLTDAWEEARRIYIVTKESILHAD